MNRKEQIAKSLNKYLDNAEQRMTKEAYIDMCNQLGDEVDWDNIPLDLDDFPDYVELAFQVFNLLSDTYSGMDSIYTGKDLSSVQSVMEILEIEPEYRRDILEVISILDSRAIKKARKQAEAARKKK